MESNKVRDDGQENFRIFGLILPSLPVLMIRLSGTFLRFKREAKKAGKIFQKELINQGYNKERANKLTDMYLENSQLIKYIKNFL
jgi:hypothetical protein